MALVRLLAADLMATNPALLVFGVIGIVVQFSFNAFVAVLLFKFGKVDRNYEALEKRLHETTDKLVDERLRSMTHDLRGSIAVLKTTLDLMTARMVDSEKDLAGIGERDHGRELQIVKGLAEIKQHLTEQAASKGDLKEHQREMGGRVDQLQRHLGAQDERLARIETQVQDAAGKRGRGA